MKRVLFVCHGNICRSPMAEFVMKNLVKQRGLEEEYEIRSAATSAEETGRPLHSGTEKILKEKGIPGGRHAARQLRRSDYAAYDLIIGMDGANLRSMLRLFGGDPEDKLRLLMEFAGGKREIADPWYTRDFETTYSDVDRGCRGLLAYLEDKEV